MDSAHVVIAVGRWLAVVVGIAALLRIVQVTYQNIVRHDKRKRDSSLDDRPEYEEIDCSGCNGTGKVTYGPEHEFVKQGWAEPGTYTCPYCGGSGKLVREIRE